jgi:hypothetical protein
MTISSRLIPLLALCAAMASPCTIAAQDTRGTLPQLELGARVRVAAPEHSRRAITGNVLLSTPHMIGIARGGDTLNLARSELARIDVSLGLSRGSGAKHGAKWGFLIGTAAYAIGVVAFDDDPGLAILAPIPGLFLGVPLGFVAGAVWGREQWQTRWAQPSR